MNRRLRMGALLVMAGALTAGCVTVRAGTAIRDPHEDPGAVTVALLDPGNYPTKPQGPLGAAGTAYEGGKAESRRMAEFVVLPFTVDPTLTHRSGFNIGVIKDPSAIAKAFADPIPGGAEGHNFVAGFTTYADAGPPPDGRAQPKSLQNLVVRFAAPPDASAAVDDMLARSATRTFGSSDLPPIPTRPVGIPRYPDTKAVAYDDPLGGHVVLAYTAHGPYLFGQVAVSADRPEAAADLVAATLDAQGPLIDRFAATPLDKLTALPVDPTGLLARTLAPAEDDRTVQDGTYGPHGALAYMTNASRDQKLFESAGLDVLAQGMVNVYRARDSAGAQAIVDDFADEVSATLSGPVSGVVGLPGAKCLSPRKDPSLAPVPQVYCLAVADRYVIEVNATQVRDAQQKVSAQYLMLTAK
jgi:hypothetical protein